MTFGNHSLFRAKNLIFRRKKIMKTTLNTIEAILATGKTLYAKLDQRLSNLTLAEKVLIGLVWGVLALIAIFPNFFWALTSIFFTAVLIRVGMSLRKKKKAAAESDIIVEEEVATE